ncbi:hypothetical protein GLV89_13580 [Halomonas alkaliantarctica]|nr:hypothetical protein [Halomonas alkaliantarctica]
MAIEFNTDFYIQSKFNQLEAAGRLEEFGLTDVASLATFFEENGVDAQQHYLNSGMEEGINPSPEFDTNAYLNAKLAQLQGEQFEGAYDDWTVDDLIAFFQERGLTPLAHYNRSGINEGIEVQAPEEATAGEEFSLTANTDTLVASDYELGEGETEEDVTRTTVDDDTIEGVASALSSARTLNADDSIDGGDGDDTLNVDVQGNFSGFSADGGVTNVETIALTNEGSINRSFDATGVEGDVNYVVNAGDATVNLIDIGSVGGSVTLNNQADGSFSIGYATDVTDGSSDNLALNLNAVGTVDDAETSADEEEAVAITAAGVESATVSATGDNVVDLSDVAATGYTVEGEGSLKVTDVANNLASFDASALAGDLVLTVNTDNARKNASIAGGEGDDTVRLGGSTTIQYTMAGVENLILANDGALTVSATNVSGLESITAATGQNATFAGLGNADLTLNLVGTAAAETTLDNSGTTTVNVTDSGATSSNEVAVSGSATLTQSTAAVVNVAENMSYTGTVKATQAESVTVAAAGELDGATLQAGNATEVVINQVDEDSSLTLNAGDAEQLTVSATADLTLTGSLGSLQVLDVDTDGKFDVSGVTGDLAAISTVNVNGTGEAKLGALGSNTQDGYGITVNAGALSDTDTDSLALETGTITTNGTAITVNAAEVLDNVTLGAIDANGGNGAGGGNVTLNLSGVGGDISLNDVTGKAVTVDAADALGTLNTGTITAETATVNGAELGENTIEADVTKSATLNGGIEDDTLIAKGAGVATISGDLGDDTFIFAESASSEAFDSALIDTVTDFGDADNIGVGTGSGDALASGDKAATAEYASSDDAVTASGGTAEAVVEINSDGVASFVIDADGTGSGTAAGEFTPDNLEAALDLLDAQVATGAAVTFEFGDNTYLFVADSNAGNMFDSNGDAATGGTDTVIELQGISAEDAASIIFAA